MGSSQAFVNTGNLTVYNADVAQLVEHLICNQRVEGSSPLAGIYAEIAQW